MFTRMDESSQEDWEHIGAEHLPHIVDMPNRVIGMLEQLESFTGGFAVNQLHHCYKQRQWLEMPALVMKWS